MNWYAGVDLGATNVRVIVASGDGSRESTLRRSTPETAGIDVTETILSMIQMACGEVGIDPDSLRAVGIGSIGPLDTAEGVVRNPANLPDAIETIPLTGPLENLAEAPVYLHNDANAGVIGERFHAEHNPDNMVYLTISTGVGAGVIVDGTVLSGWDGNAGEIGHVPLDSADELPCGCGHRGHWEAYCSGDNIPAYARHLYDGEETAVPIDSEEFDAASVFKHAEDDEFASEVIDHVLEWNARGIATVVHAYAPLVVYVGGGVALNNPDIVERLRERVPEHIMTNVPDIRLTNLGDDVVVRGALASAMTGGTGDRTNRVQ